MLSLKDFFEQNLKAINTINKPFIDNFDYDFSSVSVKIDTLKDFEDEILSAFNSDKLLFYRGERINAPSRRLIPTMLRQPKRLLERSDYGILHIDAQYLYDYYKSMGDFVELFNNTMGKADVDSLYEISAFAQHYCEFSPLIDFTKSIYPALSFALKDRDYYTDDIVLYVLELKQKTDYTRDIAVADKWIKELNIYLTSFNESDIKSVVKDTLEGKYLFTMPDPEEFKIQLEHLNTPPSPTAKLIDVPTNTRMKFQQGVFLLLTDFNLFNSNYLTKNIRDNFIITKYVINKEICPQLKEYIEKNAPWYSFRYLTDVEGAFKTAIEKP